MAKHRMFCILDGKTGIFGKPQFGLHLGAVLRDWETIVNEGGIFSKFPEDFSLHEIGEFDDEQGTVSMHPVRQQLATAREVLKARPGAPTPAVSN